MAVEDNILELLLGQKIRADDEEWRIYDLAGNQLADPAGIFWRALPGAIIMWQGIEEEMLIAEENAKPGGAVGKQAPVRTEDFVRRFNERINVRQKRVYRKASERKQRLVGGFRHTTDNRKIDWLRIFDPPQPPTAVPDKRAVHKIPRILDQYDGPGVALRTEADTLSQQQLLSAVVGPDPVAIIRKRNQQALAMILMEMM